ncbi:MAG: GNAT family N-acetyltransferase [Longimicrobiales bacterium]|nr:GNAT family N-acetyltransferase [Longimicrobiales bacterium]
MAEGAGEGRRNSGATGAGYRVVEHGSANAFLERAEAWLLEREDVNNLFLSLAYARASTGSEEPDALFATLESGPDVVGCIMRTPPHKVLVTDLPADASSEVADALARCYDRIPAVLGPEAAAVAVAEAWVRRTGGSWRKGMPQRMYRLDEVDPPSGVEGALQAATPDHEDLAVAWGEGFSRDAKIPFPHPRETVQKWIAAGRLFIWEVGGEPRSIAVASGQTPHGTRVGYVYTPPEHRRSGYASACVAALSQRLLDGGCDFCVLYTDLGNPTSNAIYPRVGYRPLVDVVDVDILPSDETE